MWGKNRTGNGGVQSVLTEEELEKEGGGKTGRNDEEKGRMTKERGSNGGKEENMKEIRILMPRESYDGEGMDSKPCKMDTRDLKEIGER